MKKNMKWVLIIFVVVFWGKIWGQDSPKTVTAKYIDQEITLDGVLDEPIWQTTEIAGDFQQFFPSDQVAAEYPTEIRILYSDTHLYVGIYAEKPPGDYVVSTLRRDFGALSNDNISLLFDTFSDGTTAYFFGVTPYGVLREGLVSDGGNDFNNTWDIKWQAEATRFDDHFVIEIAIPFTSLKFVEGSTSWRFRPYRWNNQANQQDTWVKVPQNQNLSSLADMGELHFEKPLGRSRTPFAIIPYINALAEKDYAVDDAKTKFKTGGDAKIAIGNGMNLDLTLNPDFSNVEVDDIFTNLTRFEVRLPEKRQFFIDNSDLFENFGNTFNEARPFFSRRIGLARDTLGNLIQNDIIAGARLSGKLDNNWRLGFLNIQTAKDAINEIPSNNNMMVTLQRKIGKRSNIGAFWVNRQAMGNDSFLEPGEEFNRVFGVDYNLASADNIWNGRFYLHKSFQPNDRVGNFSSQATVTYNPRHWDITQDLVYIDEDFTADLGFVPRTDRLKWGTGINYIIYDNSKVFNTHSPGFLGITYWRPSLDYKKTDHMYRFGWETFFRNQARVEARFSNNYIYLLDSFDPTRTPGAAPLPGDTGYYFNQFNLSYQSNATNVFTYNAETTLGRFFNGDITGVRGELGIRIQPKAQFSIGFDYNNIRLPGPYAEAEIFFTTFRAEISFSKKLFWSTLAQYSDRQENLGINSRLQWRFAQLSDLFLVYNDNYFTGDFGPRFRSINLKLTYWLNL
ncbi:MAG: DUF5916 domain-containing protein [Bacteroidota bacterium]|nr:DUF5916 domain-containing protein [Bacteroidota bacterium]